MQDVKQLKAMLDRYEALAKKITNAKATLVDLESEMVKLEEKIGPILLVASRVNGFNYFTKP
ncbi:MULTISPECIES: hypothetical protein [Campylobacter]|uniref:hypothetical protein n=1 Tax=Campylobacter TaxID=194 RepID=UPI00147439ED|nr:MULTISPECIES: hypothetical protein [unclassified Campylobacter]MBE3610402.1 hypothetical protein [Campylobacter sp. RM12916]